ncbi:MAG: hypothetical protein ABIF08_00640 [Nanoarchaeota archaeon]
MNERMNEMRCDIRLKKPQYRLVKNVELEDVVASINTAQNFRELGGKQDSLFYWRVESHPQDRHFSPMKKVSTDIYLPWKYKYSSIELVKEKCEEIDTKELIIKYYSTFTASEVGIFLPRTIFKNNSYYSLEFRKHFEHIVSYAGTKTVSFSSINEAEARLMMVNYLLETNILMVV